MASSVDKASSDVFNSVSSKIRLQVLRILNSRGPMPYTEIMFSLKLDPVRDAGKFVYHLKNLMESGLITVDKERKKYAITDLGKLVIGYAKDLEEYVAVKKGKLFVRTSRFSIEEFDKDKIANSLITEAKIPFEIAQDIAIEAKDRLIQLKTTYLTAPLIREFVNAILIERGLNEYRHKLTRLGMPVYDVSQLFKSSGEMALNAENIFYSSGSKVLEEYALLTSLQRDVADAHLSGSIHISDLTFWPLEPREIQHDIRFFFQNGAFGLKNPKTINDVLEIIKMAYDAVKTEVSKNQGIDMFNVFLAPFVKTIERDRIKEALNLFFVSLCQNSLLSPKKQSLSLCLELGVPEILKSVDAIGPDGKVSGLYGDYEDETNLIFEIIMEVFSELALSTPLLNPHLIIKLRKNKFDNNQYRKELMKAFGFTGKTCLPYFAYLKDGEEENYTSSGSRLSNDWTKEWESDCIRTGNMATITINLPRIVYEAEENDDKFFKLLDTSVLMVRNAFLEKKKIIQKRFAQNLFTYLSGSTSGQQYYDVNNATYALSFVGLNEAVNAFTGFNVHKGDGMKFGLEVVQRLSDYARQFTEESELRFVIAQHPQEIASTRLAELDIENYGITKTKISGSKGSPFYTDLPTVPLNSRIPLVKRLEVESEFQELLTGGHLALICLKNKEYNSRIINKLIKRITNKGVRFFAFGSDYSYCKNCGRTSLKFISKCPLCNSNLLKHFSRSSSVFKPLSLWSKAKRRVLEKRIHYSP